MNVFITCKNAYILKLCVCLALLRAGPGAGLAAYAFVGMGDRHDLIAHIVSILVFSFKGLFNQLEHISAAGLITAAAADAFVDID